jgi:unsaturated rhamnogalacturonyl hydrolase
MWDWQNSTRSEGFWGRGNGWVLMSLAETLEAMHKGSPQHAELVAMARKLARGIESTQDAGGLWHTVLDDPQSYPECSATTMFIYGLLKLIRLGALPKQFAAPARKAWAEVNARYVKDGVVTGVSGGTGPAGVKGYLSRPVGTMTWGTGAYLLAASEIIRK